MSFLQTSFNSEKKTEKSVLPSGCFYKGRHFSRMLGAAAGGGGGGGVLKEDWLGLCY